MTTERLRVSRWRSLAGVVSSAVLLGLYARGGVASVLGFVALVPWLLALDAQRTARGALLSGWLMAVAFVAAVLAWFGAAIGTYTGIGAATGTAVLLALAPVLQPQLLVFALVRHVAGRRHGPLLRALAGSAAWVACEWGWPKLLGDTLGHGLFPSTVLRQAADLGGAAGLTLLLLLVNELVAHAIRTRGDGARAVARPLLAGVVIVACMAGYGGARLSALRAPPAEDAATLRVAMVQASITDYEGLRREVGAYGVVRHVLDTHYALSWSALRDHRADVLLWSETVYPTTFGHPRSADGAALDAEIQGFVDAASVPLVFGTYDLDANGEYNAAVFLEPGRPPLGRYRKTHPFPLTEAVPRWLDGPVLRRWLPWTGSWRAGDGARVLPLRTSDGREVNVVPLICLDDVHPQLAIDGARLGAQAILGMSNDAWFSSSAHGARLHLAVAAFRSIETRMPQVRVTTNGLSAVIDDTGQVLAQTAIGQQSVLTAYVTAHAPPRTLVVQWGDWVGRAAAVLLVGFAAWAAWRARRARMPAGEPSAAVLPGDVALLTPAARTFAGVLRLVAGASLAWLGLDMLLRTGLQVQSLQQLQLFGWGVAAPLLLSGLIRRACAARMSLQGDSLGLDQRRRRIEIPLASITALMPWRIALPAAGADVRLAVGGRFGYGLMTRNPLALQRALEAACGRAGAPAGRVAQFSAERADAGARAWHRLDHPLIKFAVFPLLPALVAFRLHQVIAFGGAFGEYLTYGPLAWLTGLLLWWASWALGLMLFAGAVRVAIELIAAFVQRAWPVRHVEARDALEWIARIAFYVGVPLWLGLRLLAP